MLLSLQTIRATDTYTAERTPSQRKTVFVRPTRWMVVAVGLLVSPIGLVAQEVETRTTTVGMVGHLAEIKIPGSELEVIPLEDRDTPLVVRIVRVFPHGTDFRYEIEYYGLEPGSYDLRDFLRRKDGSSADEIPELPVEIVTELPEGQVEPNQLITKKPPRLGGYMPLVIFGGIVWVVGLVLIIVWCLNLKSGQVTQATRPKSLAEKLRPLVDRAVAGEASHEELASLERSLFTYWQKRLNLHSASPSEAIRELRKHPEAGGLMGKLESWLHHPEDQPDLDIDALLKPYRDVPERDVDLTETVPSSTNA